MSDELDTAGKVVGGVAGGLTLRELVAWFLRQRIERGIKAEAQVETDLRDRLAKLESAHEKLIERVNGGFAHHSAAMTEVRDMAIRSNEQLRHVRREVGETVTDPGHRMSPELQAAVAKYRDERER